MDRYVVEGEVSYLSFLAQKWKLRVVKVRIGLPSMQCLSSWFHNIRILNVRFCCWIHMVKVGTLTLSKPSLEIGR